MIEPTQPKTSVKDRTSLLDFVLVLAENARLLVFGPLLVGLVALAISFLVPPTFTASTSIIVPRESQGSASLLASQLSGVSSLIGVGGSFIANPSQLYLAMLRSRTIADRLIHRFNLMQRYKVKFREQARKQLESATRVTTAKSNIIVIELDDKDPQTAADIANAYVDELKHLNDGLAIGEAQQRRAFFEKQLEKAQENLKRAQIALGEAGVSEDLIKSSPQATVARVAQLKAQVTAQEVRVAVMRGYLSEQSPELRQAERELDSIRAQLTLAERAEPKGGVGRAEYINRFRDFKYQETLFELMTKQYEIARLDEAREGSLVQVVDVALPPELRSKPRRALIAVLATLITGFLLVFFVLFREFTRSALRDPVRAQKHLRLPWILRKLLGS